MTDVNRRRASQIGLVAMCALLALLLLPREMWRVSSGNKGNGSSDSTGRGEVADNSDLVRTKSVKRPAPRPRATHLPDALPSFYLPSMEIEALTLSEALNLLLLKYAETCEQTGEVPLRIRFLNPLDGGKRISLHLQATSFEQAVRLLAAVSGLAVNRSGVTYKFLESTAIRSEADGVVVRTSASSVADLAEVLGTENGTLQEIFSGSGLLADPNTAISMDKRGGVSIVGGTAGDRALISDLLVTLSAKSPIQLKIVPKILDLPDGFELGVPSGSVLSDSEVQILMRRLAAAKGTNLMTLPSIVTRSDESAKVELLKEVKVPKVGSPDEHTSFNVGKIFDAQTSPLGLGHVMMFRYEDSDIADSNETLSKRQIVSSEAMGYQSNHGTRVTIAKREDGGVIATFVTATLIDVTGRPVSQDGFRD